MAFLLNKTSRLAFRLHSQKADDSLMQSRRGLQVEAGAREKALLAEHPSLQRFKPYNKSLQKLKYLGDVATLVVVTGCCYEMYVKAVLREEARKEEKNRTSVWSNAEVLE